MVCGHNRSGKDTFAEVVLEKYNVGIEAIALADPLKQICKLLGWNGEKDREGRVFLNLVANILKREPIPYDTDKSFIQKTNDLAAWWCAYNLLPLNFNQSFFTSIAMHKIRKGQSEVSIIKDIRYVHEFRFFYNKFMDDDMALVCIKDNHGPDYPKNDVELIQAIDVEFARESILNTSDLESYVSRCKHAASSVLLNIGYI
jgi:hypothetical protein